MPEWLREQHGNMRVLGGIDMHWALSQAPPHSPLKVEVDVFSEVHMRVFRPAPGLQELMLPTTLFVTRFSSAMLCEFALPRY